MKLMMAAGFSRNFAAACALRVLEWGSYEIAYTKLRDFDSIPKFVGPTVLYSLVVSSAGRPIKLCVTTAMIRSARSV